MSSPFLGLRTATYKVGNLDEAKAWYSSVFETEPYFDQPFYVGYNIGGFELGLVPDEKNDGKTDGVVTYWGVADVEAVLATLLANGATLYEDPTDVGDGIKVAAAKDPWGNVVGVIYNPHFSSGS
ncbi:VOC family protein [Emticicia sp. TH156]|uniref:VOC family protein n=1 Tax=Emticicia sp. TH156 TaxID=2067454 RepID=UPI000C7784E0|nr:VOC family protein [Emticicia sp. TH156]PLK45056.1 glyoxalase/bleomycin resistance/extradiol dioxygenase family protein [Emticicia sp. TH156]